MSTHIYTRTGDDGTTALFGGKRTRKNSAVVTAYGTIDELNSYIGLIIALSERQVSYLPLLMHIQSDLLMIGSMLSGWDAHDPTTLSNRISEMEQWIDMAENEVGELHAFVLPGGTQISAIVHIARTVTRRAERHVISAGPTDPQIVPYLNRLSDLFFMIARVINKTGGISETEWTGIRKK